MNTSQLICWDNQQTGFHMIQTLALNGFKSAIHHDLTRSSLNSYEVFILEKKLGPKLLHENLQCLRKCFEDRNITKGVPKRREKVRSLIFIVMFCLVLKRSQWGKVVFFTPTQRKTQRKIRGIDVQGENTRRFATEKLLLSPLPIGYFAFPI